MGQTPNGRIQADRYKQELRGLIERLVEKGNPNDANVAALSALGEVTAEFGIYAVGPAMTVSLFLQLAHEVETSIVGDQR